MGDTGRARIERARCYAYGRCVETLPEVFELDDADTAVARAVEAPLPALMDAADACPMGAISVTDPGSDEVVYP